MDGVLDCCCCSCAQIAVDVLRTYLVLGWMRPKNAPCDATERVVGGGGGVVMELAFGLSGDKAVDIVGGRSS